MAQSGRAWPADPKPRAEGVRRIVIVTDEPLKYVNAEQQLPGGITLLLFASIYMENAYEGTGVALFFSFMIAWPSAG